MTILLTLVGTIVFFISLFTVGFKTGFWRLAAIAIVGLVLDVILFTTAGVVTYAAL